MPKPIPVAIVGAVFGRLPQPILMILAAASHLLYGGVWGGIGALMLRPFTFWRGIGFGIFLWVLMQAAFLPFIGWGLFGPAVTPMIAAATLILHLVYGAVFGSFVDRHGRVKPASDARDERRAA